MNKFKTIFSGHNEEEGSALFELFHENSKLTPYQTKIPYAEVQEKMKHLIVSFDYSHFLTTYFTTPPEPVNVSLDYAILNRRTNLTPIPVEISLQQLHTLLHYSYGITSSNEDTDFLYPFRATPSGGALFPLEIYFHHNYVTGLESGLYHYNPTLNCISCLQKGDYTAKLKRAFMQPDLVQNSTLVAFITGIFPRSAFKYGERAYRFANIEAGHIAQNFALTATGLGLSCVTVGGFVDKLIDDFLMLDGVNHSILYAIALNGRK